MQNSTLFKLCWNVCVYKVWVVWKHVIKILQKHQKKIERSIHRPLCHTIGHFNVELRSRRGIRIGGPRGEGWKKEESSSDISSVLCDMIIMVCEAQVPAERVCWKDGNKCHLAVTNLRDDGVKGGYWFIRGAYGRKVSVCWTMKGEWTLLQHF